MSANAQTAAATLHTAERSLWCLCRAGMAYGLQRADYEHLLIEHEFAAWQAQESLRELVPANEPERGAA